MENKNCLLSTYLNPFFKGTIFDPTTKERCKSHLKPLLENTVQIVTDPFAHLRNTQVEHSNDEMISYERDGYLTGTCSFDDIINYWEVKKESFPNLYKLAMKYLCYLASSCPSERLFSDPGLFYTQLRTNTSTENLKRQCRLHSFYLTNGNVSN